jgi:peptidoglycan/LPS O-acetylase OafA/YrhL
MYLEYRKDVDGLLALSIIGVIGYHTDVNLLPEGFAGVDIFFVISGYIILIIIIQDIRKGKFSLVDFWIKRLLRLLPALYLMIAFTLMMVFAIYRPVELVSFSVAGIYAIFYFWKSINYFEPNLH